MNGGDGAEAVEARDGVNQRVAATMKRECAEEEKPRLTIAMHQIWGKFGGQGIVRRARRVWD